MSITLSLPPQNPSLNSVVVNPGGGSITPGNYSFCMFSTNNRYAQAPLYLSKPSNTIDVSILVNSSVTLNYTVNTSTANTQMLMYSKNGEIWKEVTYYGVSNVSTYTATSVVPSVWTQTPLQMIYSNNRIYGLSNDRGIAQVKLTGSGNISISDINNVLKDSSLVEGQDYIYGKNTLIGNYSIDARSYGEGTLDISGSTIYLAGGFHNYPSSLTIENKKFTYVSAPTHWTINGYGTYQHTFGHIANASINNMSFIAAQIDTSISTTNTARLYVYSGKMDNVYGENLRMVSGINYFVNSTLYLNDNYDIPDGTIDMTLYTVYFGTADKNKTHRRLNLYKREPFPYLFLVWSNGNNTHKFIDCNFYSENDKLTKYTPWECFGYYGPGGLSGTPLAYRYKGTGGLENNTIEVYYTTNINVKDTTGDNIENASIYCFDSSNNEVFNELSDSSGNISKEIMVVRNHSYPDNEWLYENYNPFRFIVSKEGYQTSYVSNFEINETTSLKITLLDNVAPVYYNQQIDGSINQDTLNGSINTNTLTGSVSTTNIITQIILDE